MAQPGKLTIRLLNENARWPGGGTNVDGVDMDQTQTYDFSNGVYPRLKAVIPYWAYNSETGTMKEKVTYEFSLTMDNPEKSSVIMLELFCNEAEKNSYEIPLFPNSETGTFDGSITFPGNTITANDLP